MLDYSEISAVFLTSAVLSN